MTRGPCREALLVFAAFKRPREFAPEQIPDLAAGARRGEFTALYRRSHVRLTDRERVESGA